MTNEKKEDNRMGNSNNDVIEYTISNFLCGR